MRQIVICTMRKNASKKSENTPAFLPPVADPEGGHRGHVPLPPQTHGNFFKHEDELLCDLIQHTEYCSCCAFFYHALLVCITIHLYPSSGVEHGARFVAFSGQAYLFERGCCV